MSQDPRDGWHFSLSEISNAQDGWHLSGNDHSTIPSLDSMNPAAHTATRMDFPPIIRGMTNTAPYIAVNFIMLASWTSFR